MQNNIPRIDAVVSQGLELARRAFSKRHRIDLLAPKMGTTHKTLLDRLNPDNDYHRLSVEHLQMVTALTGDTQLIVGLCHDAGLSVYESPTDAPTVESIIPLILKRHQVSGEFSALLHRFMADGVLDDDEKMELIKSVDDAIAILNKTKASLSMRGVA
jgi:hypothetical protein